MQKDHSSFDKWCLPNNLKNYYVLILFCSTTVVWAEYYYNRFWYQIKENHDS